jgi:hypothetical protein
LLTGLGFFVAIIRMMMALGNKTVSGNLIILNSGPGSDSFRLLVVVAEN